MDRINLVFQTLMRNSRNSNSSERRRLSREFGDVQHAYTKVNRWFNGRGCHFGCALIIDDVATPSIASQRIFSTQKSLRRHLLLPYKDWSSKSGGCEYSRDQKSNAASEIEYVCRPGGKSDAEGQAWVVDMYCFVQEPSAVFIYRNCLGLDPWNLSSGFLPTFLSVICLILALCNWNLCRTSRFLSCLTFIGFNVRSKIRPIRTFCIGKLISLGHRRAALGPLLLFTTLQLGPKCSFQGYFGAEYDNMTDNRSSIRSMKLKFNCFMGFNSSKTFHCLLCSEGFKRHETR